MSRRNLLLGLAVALLATAAPAGEIKIHNWPCEPIAQEVTTIPVVMDVGFWIKIVNQNTRIKLQQKSIHTYEGCTNLQVRCNFDLTLSCKITSTGAVTGSYSCSVQGADINVPGGTATLCAKLTNANLGGQPGGSKNVHVASITVRVVPRS